MKAQALLIGGLMLAILASAVAVVQVKHDNRALFVDLKALERQRDALEVEWGQLQLEQSTWAANERIEQIAREQLGLQEPSLEAVVVVRP